MSALMFGVGCLMQYVCENKPSLVKAGFGELSTSTLSCANFFHFCPNFLSCEKIVLQLRNLVLFPQKVSLTRITKSSIPVMFSD